MRGEVAEWTSARVVRDRAEAVVSGRVDLHRDEDTDAAVVAERLREACAGSKGLVTLGLATEDLILQVLRLPSSDESELGGMVELQVDKFSPFPVETMVVSHEVLAQEDDSSRVLVAAVQRSVVEEQGALLTSARLAPDRVDAVILGRWRVLKDAGKIDESGQQVVLLVGEGWAELIVVQDGVPVLLRALPGSEELSASEWVEELSGEISYSLMSLDLESDGAEGQSALLCYEGDEPAGVLAMLQEQCECEVVAVPVDTLAPAGEGLVRRVADRRGARVDLVPRAWRTAEESAQFRSRAKRMVGVMLGVWLLVVGGFFGWLQFQKGRVASLRLGVEEKQGPAEQVAADMRRARRIQRYEDRTYSALECLRAVTLAKPNGVDVTSFRYDRMRGSGGLMIDGVAASDNLVYTFQSELDKAQIFRSTSLPSAVQRDRKTRKSKFKIKIDLAGGEE